jgi:hypothetical protein
MKNQIKGLKSLLAEAAASEELTKIPEGVSASAPSEVTPAVDSAAVVKTVASSEDVKPVAVAGGKPAEIAPAAAPAPAAPVKPEAKVEVPTADDKKEDDKDSKKLDEAIEQFNKFISVLHEENQASVVVPTGTTDGPATSAPAAVDTAAVVSAVTSGDDVKPVANDQAAEQPVIEPGTLDKIPQEGTPEVATDAVVQTATASQDVAPVTVDGGKPVAEIKEDAEVAAPAAAEEKKEDEKPAAPAADGGVVLPEGTLDKKPEEVTPVVDTAAVVQTVSSGEDVAPVTVDGGKPVAEIKEEDETAAKEAAPAAEGGVVLPEGTLDKKPEEAEGGVVLPEGTLDKKPEEVTPTVDTAEVVKTVVDGEDVQAVQNVDAATPAMAPAEECKDKEFHSVAEVITAGTAAVDTPEKKAAVTESIAILLANENHDLLFEEYASCLSKAKALREHIVKKYSVVAGNRTADMFESMSLMEAKIKAAKKKKDLFKPAKEQIEVNAAEQEAEAKPITENEAAFGKVEDAPAPIADDKPFYPADADTDDKKACFDRSFAAYAQAHAGATREDFAKSDEWKNCKCDACAK